MDFKYLLIDLSNYIGAVPCMIGIYCWNNLTSLMKGYLIGVIINACIGILSIISAKLEINNHFVFPLLAINTGILYCFMFWHLSENKIIRYSITVFYLFFILYIFYDLITNNIKYFNFQLFTLIDISSLILSAIWLNKIISSQFNITKKPLLWLLFSIFSGALYDVLLTQLSGKMALYFTNKWQDIFALNISPIFQIIKMSILAYAFYLARHQKFNSNKIPDLEQGR
ncbi:hypothetical protein [Runella rosea]|nr:hypothetical protein [Runella rosea]